MPKQIEPRTLPGFRDFLPSWLWPLGKVSVLIDAANLERSARDTNWRINYKKLYRYLQTLGSVTYVRFYTVNSQTEPQQDFSKSLSRFGYEVISKPIKIIRLKDGSIIRKANFDVEIAADACLDLNKYDTFFLFSGDSDFSYLLSELKKRGKRCVVVSTRFHISKELITVANFYLDIRRLRKVIFKPKKGPAFSQGGTNNLSTAKKILAKKNKYVKR